MRSRQNYLDSLRVLRDTLHVYQWRNDLYELRGYPVRTPRDSSDKMLPYLFTAVPYLSFPAEDNSGRAPVPLWFQPDSVTGFRWGFAFPFYFLQSPETFTHLASRRPYTQLVFQLGTAGPPKNNRRGDQRFFIVHTQPLGKGSQFQISFFRLGNTGFYRRQWSSLSSLSAGSTHRFGNGRWFLRTHLLWQRMRYEENGGLSPAVLLEENGYYTKGPGGDSVFTPIGRRDTWPVRLSEAEMLYNRWDFTVAQDYLVGPWRRDSLMRRALTPLAFTSLVAFTDDKATFTDKTGAADSFFTHYYWTPGASLWRGHRREAAAEAGLRLAPFGGKLRFSTLWAAMRYSWMQVGQDTVIPVRSMSAYHNVMVRSGLHLEVTSRLTFTTRFDAHIAGYTAGSFSLRPEITWRPTPADSLHRRFIRLSAGLWMQNLTPAFIQRNLLSNHFLWNLNLRPQTHTTAWAEASLPAYRLNLRTSFTVLRHLHYYDQEALPRNVDALATVVQARLNGDLFFFLKNLHFPITLNIQKASSPAVRVPLLYGRAGFLLRHRLANKKLLMEWGMDAFYHTLYEPQAWMPGLQVWYLQDGFMAGNYPVINAHVTLAFGRFRASFLGAHLNRGFPRSAYWLAPGFPVMDRSVRLSLQWGLFN